MLPLAGPAREGGWGGQIAPGPATFTGGGFAVAQK